MSDGASMPYQQPPMPMPPNFPPPQFPPGGGPGGDIPNPGMMPPPEGYQPMPPPVNFGGPGPNVVEEVTTVTTTTTFDNIPQPGGFPVQPMYNAPGSQPATAGGDPQEGKKDLDIDAMEAKIRALDNL